MVVYRGIPIVLPVADSLETEKGETLVITIDEKGDVFVDQEFIPGDELLSRLNKERAAFPGKTAIISGHKGSPYGTFVDVLDDVRLAGFQKVSMEAVPRQLEK
jgi:biopolymer transport protein ExbD